MKITVLSECLCERSSPSTPKEIKGCKYNPNQKQAKLRRFLNIYLQFGKIPIFNSVPKIISSEMIEAPAYWGRAAEGLHKLGPRGQSWQ